MLAKAAGLLLRYPIKVLVVACNTATAYALEHLAAATDVPVLGVISPGADAAVRATRSGKIGVAGTEGTIRSGVYQDAIRARRPDAEITDQTWPLLVSLAEEGWVDHPVSRLTMQTYLAPFVDAEIDTLVLGCTHYPVFKSALKEAWDALSPSAPVALIDSAEEVTRQLTALLQDRDLTAPDRVGRRTFFCTDAAERFRRVGGTFFDGDLSGASVVDL